MAPAGSRDPGFEQVTFVRDGASGLRAVIAVHSTVRGPAFGGIRRRSFGGEAEALEEVLGLARAMSHKCALAGLPAGGAKTVILDAPGLDVDAAYTALGRAVERMGGTYVCGPDVGTGRAALDAIRQVTHHVNPPGNDAGASTAAGVLAGLRGVLTLMGAGPDVAGMTFAIQGLGSVGSALARFLLERDARVLGADPETRAAEAARAMGVELVAPGAILETPCDVLMPCALGGILDAGAAERVLCRAICGSANNQLANPTAGQRLAERGILVAPDIVVSAGAVIEGVHTVLGGERARARVQASIDAIEGQIVSLGEEARSTGRSPHQVAIRRAEAALRRDDSLPG